MKLTEEQMAINRLLTGNTAHSCKADYIKLAIKALEKQVPKKIVSACKTENVICGYCPNCKGTVRFAETWLVKTKGQHCSWCGQKLDWSDIYD